MALLSYALTTSTELKAELSISTSNTARDSVLEDVANRATGLIEAYLDREVMNRVSGTVTTEVTEHYTILAEPSPDLWLAQWPVISITSVKELSAWPSTYGSALASGTEYLLDSGRGRLTRIDASGESAWPTGRRAIQVVYKPGYAALADVPYPIRDVARRFGALLYTEIDRKQFGVSAYSDSLGNTTRFWSARLTDDMKAELAPFRRQYGLSDVYRAER